jgi:hypothetical protein
MKRFLTGFLVSFLLLSAVGFAKDYSDFPGILKNAKYVYVTSYDGSEFSHNVLPEDRQAIVNVQNGIRDWGKYTLVYEPWQADMIVVVESRGSEDLLAVYDPQMWRSGSYLWRVMGRGGLDQGEMPLFKKFQSAVEKLDGKKISSLEAPASSR